MEGPSQINFSESNCPLGIEFFGQDVTFLCTYGRDGRQLVTMYKEIFVKSHCAYCRYTGNYKFG
jgi:hypothetical protein